MKARAVDTENRYFCGDSLMTQTTFPGSEIARDLTLWSCFSGLTQHSVIKVKFDTANELSNVSQFKDCALSARHPCLQSVVKPLSWRQFVQGRVGFDTVEGCRLAMTFQKKVQPLSSG
jgi:hypothetical protein